MKNSRGEEILQSKGEREMSALEKAVCFGRKRVGVMKEDGPSYPG